MFKSLVLCAVLVFSLSAYAFDNQNSELDIAKITLHDLGEVDDSSGFSESNYVEEKSLGEVIVIVDQLIALGKKVWPIVEAGRPVSNVKLGTISVLPASQGVALEGWSSPRHRKYRLVYENTYGWDVITFEFTVHYQYGGHNNGVGKYLDAVTLTANFVDVSWGFDFSAQTRLVRVTNRGTRANPIAGVTLEVSQVAKTVVSDMKSTSTFHISGDGKFTKF